MWPFSKPVPTPVEPEAPRLSARVTGLENAVDDIESRLEWLMAELKSVRGLAYSLKKRDKDAPEQEIGNGEGVDQPPPQTLRGTAHLARRLRGW